MYALRSFPSAATQAALSRRMMHHQAAAQRHGGTLPSHVTSGSTSGTAPTAAAATRAVALVAATAGSGASDVVFGASAAGAAGAALAALLDPSSALKSGSTAAARIFPNENVDAAPWEASCIELGTEVVEEDDATTSFGVVVSRITSADATQPAAMQTVVRLYFETARREGLTSFRSVAQRVALGELPGRTENRMSVGYAVWIVPREEYIAMLAHRPQIAASPASSPNRA